MRFVSIYSNRLLFKSYKNKLSESKDLAEPWLTACLYDDGKLAEELIQLGSDLVDGYLWLNTAFMVNAFNVLEVCIKHETLDSKLVLQCLKEDVDGIGSILEFCESEIICKYILKLYIENSFEFDSSPLLYAVNRDLAGKYIFSFPRMLERIIVLEGRISPILYSVINQELNNVTDARYQNMLNYYMNVRYNK